MEFPVATPAQLLPRQLWVSAHLRPVSPGTSLRGPQTERGPSHSSGCLGPSCRDNTGVLPPSLSQPQLLWNSARIRGDCNSVHAFPSTFQNSPSIIPFPDCWFLPCLAGGWRGTLKSWLQPSLQALRCQRGFTSATLVLHERAQSSPACLPIASKGLTVAHNPSSVFWL